MTELTTNGRAVREALLVIADIRGYTPFMKAHWTSLAHAQDVVASLLEAVIDAAPGLTPLEIEGDAAFFYAWAAGAESAAADGLIEHVVAMHRAFHACQQEIVDAQHVPLRGVPPDRPPPRQVRRSRRRGRRPARQAVDEARRRSA